MPRIRTTKPKFWDDIKISKVSRDSRLIFIGIWNFADDLGVVVAEPIWLKSKILPYDILGEGVFEGWLKELVEYSFIIPIKHNNEDFFFIRNFDKHQKIDKPNFVEVFISSNILRQIVEQSTTNRRKEVIDNQKETIVETSSNDPRGRGEDRDKDISNSLSNTENFVFNVETEILGNQKEFESICMRTYKKADHAKSVLRKYHLWLQEKEKYPVRRTSCFAGFEKWLLNEKNQINGTDKQGNKSIGEKLGTSDARIEKAKSWGGTTL
jgi:hypothetical protein